MREPLESHSARRCCREGRTASGGELARRQTIKMQSSCHAPTSDTSSLGCLQGASVHRPPHRRHGRLDAMRSRSHLHAFAQAALVHARATPASILARTTPPSQIRLGRSTKNAKVARRSAIPTVYKPRQPASTVRHPSASTTVCTCRARSHAAYSSRYWRSVRRPISPKGVPGVGHAHPQEGLLASSALRAQAAFREPLPCP
jgi:hypothetical protein